MRKWLEAEEAAADSPENENRTDDRPQNSGTRQGETPEAKPRGAALTP